MTTVLLADDQELVRAGFRLVLELAGVEVVGEAADGDEAVKLARRLRPDVALMDVRMPGTDGIEATRRIVGDRLPTRVLMLSLSDPFCSRRGACPASTGIRPASRPRPAALKEAVRGSEQSFGLWVMGGKGASLRTAAEIAAACETTGHDGDALARAGRLAAKVDNTAVQSGHQLYHHSFLLTANGGWAIVQQGCAWLRDPLAWPSRTAARTAPRCRSAARRTTRRSRR